MLARVRDQYQSLTRPRSALGKAISHHPELEGRVHVYRQGANHIVQAMDNFADYAAVYSSYAWVQKAIAKIAENLAGLPVRVVDSKDKPIAGHPLTELFAYVNDEQTPLDLWSSYTIYMMLGGEAPYEIVPDTLNRPIEIWIRRPDRVAVVPDASRLIYPTAVGYIYESEEALAAPIEIEARWMVHDRFFNPLNSWRGLAPINAVREGVTIDLFAQAWSKSFLKNNARPDFAIIAPQGITKSEKDRMEEQFTLKHRGADNWHLPAILEEGVTDIKTFSFPPKDLEWLEQRKFSRDEVGAIFGVPDEIMGYGKDTYENFQTALEVFWTLTMQPFARRRDVTLTHHFTRYGLGLRSGERFDTDFSEVGVLQEDLTPKAELARKFWDMGTPFNRIDEMLKLGVGPIPGGEIGYLPKSLTTAELIANPPPPPAPVLPAPNPSTSTPPTDDAPPAEPPAPKMIYLLPEGAQDGAKRALKKLIQAVQDVHLRALREGKKFVHAELDHAELERWLGSDAGAVIWRAEASIRGIKGDHDAVNAAYTALKSNESLTRLLEVAAPAFFTLALPTARGAITPSWVKAMLLRLDPDDDEAEQVIRLAMDRRTTRNVTQAFNDMLETLYPQGYGEFADPNIEAQRVRRLFEEDQQLYDTLSRALQDGTDLGVSVAVSQLENIGYGFDWTLANIEAREWANRYTGELIRGISETTQRGVQQSVTRWIDNGEPLESLIQDIQPLFGRARAERIAVTETTRAYQQGSETAWRASGVVAEMEWVTVNDERVCPQCGPMQGQRAPLGGTFAGVASPPRHVSCRCFTRPVIQEE